MNKIVIQTKIYAPTKRCFYLATSIDLHKLSTLKSNEQAIDGITEGLINLNETVTWRAKHFGLWHKMKVKITKYEKPNYFVDELISGPFKYMKHSHKFNQIERGTLMIDEFEFISPFGILGVLTDRFFLKKYMIAFLKERNLIIKEYAETDKWKQVL